MISTTHPGTLATDVKHWITFTRVPGIWGSGGVGGSLGIWGRPGTEGRPGIWGSEGGKGTPRTWGRPETKGRVVQGLKAA